jgi:hypothetical protein
MKIKTNRAAAASPGSKVKAVHEAEAEFRIEFEDGSSATFCLADPGSSVAVRDKRSGDRVFLGRVGDWEAAG